MTPSDLVALSPYMVVAATAVVLMLMVAFYRSHAPAAILTGAGLTAAFGTLFAVHTSSPGRQVTALILVDDFALFFVGLILAAALAVLLLSYGYLRDRPGNREEYYLLILLAVLGGSVLAASTHFASLFLGLEILSISLYALIAYPRTLDEGIEAAIKYLVLSATSAAFLLFGMALIYSQLGTMRFSLIASTQSSGANPENLLVLAGSAMLFVGIGFKLSVVPFHMWAPDVYQGAPAPVAAFISTVSKGAIFAVLLRYFTVVDIRGYGSLYAMIAVVSFASMAAGNLLALLQDNVKRILAYSSIAHMGYLLVAFLAGGALGTTAVAIYLVAYFAATLAAFGVVVLISGPGEEVQEMDGYRGLFWRRPWLATVLTVALLSLAGIPLTAGFIGKLYLLAAGVGPALWVLVLTLVVTSTIGLFYYLRVVTAMLSRPVEGPVEAHPPLSAPGAMALVALTIALFWLGIFPTPVIQILQDTVGRLTGLPLPTL